MKGKIVSHFCSASYVHQNSLILQYYTVKPGRLTSLVLPDRRYTNYALLMIINHVLKIKSHRIYQGIKD